MRKSIWLLTVLLLLSIVLVSASAAGVSSLQNSVTVTERPMTGDPAAISDLQMQIRAVHDVHLVWDTVFSPAAAEQAQTGFQFVEHVEEESVEYYASTYLELGILNYSMSFGGAGGDLVEEEDDPSGRFASDYATMLKPAIDVASRTGAGETHTETLRVRDYYEYFKVGLESHIGGSAASEILPDETQRAAQRARVQELFRIPVPDDLMVEVSVTKANNGNITEVHCNESKQSAKGIVFDAYTEDAIYGAVAGYEEDRPDFSHMPQGNGIYCIPLDRPDGRNYYIAVERMENVYPLPDETIVLSVSISEHGEQLLVFTREQGQVVLTVLQRSTMEPIQQMVIAAEYAPSVWRSDEILVLRYTGLNGEPYVQAYTWENGGYELWMHVPFYEEVTADNYRTPQIIFDGKRLVLANLLDNWSVSSCWVQAFDQTGLIYAGQYVHSGDLVRRHLGNTSRNRLTLSWGS